MADHPTPEEIRRATFRVVFRGFDQGEVAAYLDRLATVVDELETERDLLEDRLGEFADRDLKREFESVGKEISAVLEAARSAAESMRERASTDAARWRSEAMAEVESMRRDARADAESMRSDAWTTGSQLLEQVQVEVDRQRAETEQSSLAIRGEAEREAHRLTATARREADEIQRSAKMEAERMVSQARVEHDEIISSAHRKAEAAQERARALEERRNELMEELESVRSALTTVEGELEERRQGIGLSEPTDLPDRMVVASDDGTEVTDWEDGATVRVIRPSGDEEDKPASPTAPPDDEADADRLAQEVAAMRLRDDTEEEHPVEIEEAEETEEAEGAEGLDPTDTELPSDTKPPFDTEPPSDMESPAVDDFADEPPPVEVQADEPGEDREEAASPPQPDPDESPEAPLEPEDEPAVPSESLETSKEDDLSVLFARLRQPGEEPEGPDTIPEEPEPASGEGPSEPVPEMVEAAPANGQPPQPAMPDGVDPFETRERLLLPITNSALRTVKRALADAQNQALEELRVNQGDWAPDPDDLEDAFGEDMDALVDQASQAGVEAAIEMGVTGLRNLSPQVPAADPMGHELVDALDAALSAVGPGPRERQAAVSRVFRGWRTDEAERRIRTVALASYHAALHQALSSQDRSWQWVPAGRLCPSCRQAAEAHESIPPVHRDCQCTIVPV